MREGHWLDMAAGSQDSSAGTTGLKHSRTEGGGYFPGRQPTASPGLHGSSLGTVRGAATLHSTAALASPLWLKGEHLNSFC